MLFFKQKICTHEDFFVPLCVLYNHMRAMRAQMLAHTGIVFKNTKKNINIIKLKVS